MAKLGDVEAGRVFLLLQGLRRTAVWAGLPEPELGVPELPLPAPLRATPGHHPAQRHRRAHSGDGCLRHTDSTKGSGTGPHVRPQSRTHPRAPSPSASVWGPRQAQHVSNPTLVSWARPANDCSLDGLKQHTCSPGPGGQAPHKVPAGPHPLGRLWGRFRSSSLPATGGSQRPAAWGPHRPAPPPRTATGLPPAPLHVQLPLQDVPRTPAVPAGPGLSHRPLTR